ncbi:MAG TPA: hypothetical protein VFF11_05405, partial [Candidatus Binatia bacterium]|nr:hypothetical protein [Candidatus Binatia bacterium]
MKTSMIKKLTALCLALTAGAVVAHADALYWDPGLTGGSGGTGTWDLNTSANWFGNAGDATWKDNSAAGTNTAYFSGNNGTVTLNQNVSASNLVFYTSGYTISGSGTLTLGSGGIDTFSLSSGTTTIGPALNLVGGQQAWLLGYPGTILAVNGP